MGVGGSSEPVRLSHGLSSKATNGLHVTYSPTPSPLPVGSTMPSELPGSQSDGPFLAPQSLLTAVTTNVFWFSTPQPELPSNEFSPRLPSAPLPQSTTNVAAVVGVTSTPPALRRSP